MTIIVSIGGHAFDRIFECPLFQWLASVSIQSYSLSPIVSIR